MRLGRFGSDKPTGRSGGADRAYYKGFYRAKGKGKVHEYVAKHGPPPGKGGNAFHGEVGRQKGPREAKGGKGDKGGKEGKGKPNKGGR